MTEKADANPFMPQVEVVDPAPKQVEEEGTIETTNHPLASFFHVAFKVLAIVIYIFGGLVVRNSSSQFVYVFLLSAFDFYCTKNFSGRYLIGMRWWSSDSSDKIVNGIRYEVSDHPERYASGDSRFFWTVLYSTPVAWLFLSLVCILKFNVMWLLVAAFSLFSSGFNLYCYLKAARKSQRADGYASLPSRFAKSALT
ncbi:hypothetical protein JH06_5095 [Blastocystis sp. subtype 4]|uniref:hypothetical protein n=1 Tax=Blastocystis sp. subtype 4 TaxID=944170 RepID=UPI0007113B90|nr:hypothetical protein JH06_5095 [Blastocystis sp. subtype 4]KNB41571.1 hypothetical protein JH06_5095 [Blastocystis sp. subtype 4]|eukprot:XP_014525014.1 hypothetical protein JH06_5095 [Blastocystis sp. subtype 4]